LTLYMDDFVKIVECFIYKKPERKHYNVTPTESIDLLTAAEMINQVGGFESEIRVLNEGMNAEYTGDNSRLLSEIGGDFKFTEYQKAFAALFKYYSRVLDALDIETIRKDPYLESCWISTEQKQPLA